MPKKKLAPAMPTAMQDALISWLSDYTASVLHGIYTDCDELFADLRADMELPRWACWRQTPRAD